MGRMKQRVSWLCVVLMLVLILTGCSNGGTSASSNEGTGSSADGDTVTLKFLHKWPQPQYMPYFEEVVKSFEEEHPNIHIQMEAVADEPIKDKLRVLMGTDSQPDIFFTWSGEFANKFVRSGNAYDLTEALNMDEVWKDGFMTAGLEPFENDGKNYGVPFRINGKFFVYNKEIFQDLGLVEPLTWSEFMDVCEKIKSNGVIPIAFGNQSPWAGCHYLTGLNQKMVPDDMRLTDYNPKSGEFKDEGYVKALQYFEDLNTKGYFNEGVNSTSHDMAHQLFASGKAAMIYVELEEFPTVEGNIPGKWDFFPMPEITSGKGSKNYLTGAPDGFMISAKTQHPDEAVMFLKYLTSKSMADQLVQMLGWPSPIKDTVTAENGALPALVKGMEGIEDADGMALWLDTDIHIKISDVYLPGLQELVNGTKTPEEIMDEVQAKAQEVQSEM